jgi:uncharacterized protein (TIGR00369 family)
MRPDAPAMNDLRDGWFWRMYRGEAPPPPVALLLKQRIVRVDPERGELDAEFEAATSFANPAGHVQGGMLAAMLDALTASVVDATLQAGERVASLNLNVSFMKAAQVGPILGRASLVRKGRTVAHASAELVQGEIAVATATAVCMVVSPAGR